MTDSNVNGPQVGDRVQVELFGRVTELVERDGMAGALVELGTGEATQPRIWIPAEALVVLRQAEHGGE
jgi:hypothetical protein